MTRKEFLQRIGIGIAAIVIAPALLIPERKTLEVTAYKWTKTKDKLSKGEWEKSVLTFSYMFEYDNEDGFKKIQINEPL